MASRVPPNRVRNHTVTSDGIFKCAKWIPLALLPRLMSYFVFFRMTFNYRVCYISKTSTVSRSSKSTMGR